MNVTNLQKTRDYIAQHPGAYDQSNWMHDCGTPACVAGAAVAVCGGTLLDEDRCITSDGENWLLPDHAEKLLALTADQRAAMFTAAPYDSFTGNFDLEPVTAAEALAMLDHAIEHDEVRWPDR